MKLITCTFKDVDTQLTCTVTQEYNEVMNGGGYKWAIVSSNGNIKEVGQRCTIKNEITAELPQAILQDYITKKLD